MHREIALALPGDLESSLLERGHDPGAISYFTEFYALNQIVGDHLSRVLFCRESGNIQEFPMPRLEQPRTGRIVGPGPPLAIVEIVPQAVEQGVRLVSLWAFASGRSDIERFPGPQIHPRSKDMNMAAATLLQVEHRGPDILIGVEPSPGGALKFVEHLVDLFTAGRVFRGEGDDTGSVFVFEDQRVRDGGHQEGIATQDLYGWADATLPILGTGEILGHASAGTLALPAAGGEFNVHCRPLAGDGVWHQKKQGGWRKRNPATARWPGDGR